MALTNLLLGTLMYFGASFLQTDALAQELDLKLQYIPDSIIELPLNSRRITMTDSDADDTIMFTADKKAKFITEVYDIFKNNDWNQTRCYTSGTIGNKDIRDDVNIRKHLPVEILGVYEESRLESKKKLDIEIDQVYLEPVLEIPKAFERGLLRFMKNEFGYRAKSLDELAREWPDKIEDCQAFNILCDSISYFIAFNTYYRLEKDVKDKDEINNEKAQYCFENLIGDCEYANTYLSSVLRKMGIPTRHVCGWQEKTARRNNGHTMTQAFNPYSGWTIFDATSTKSYDGIVADCDCFLERIEDNVDLAYDMKDQTNKEDPKILPAIRMLECIDRVKSRIQSYQNDNPGRACLIQSYLEEYYSSNWYKPDLE